MKFPVIQINETEFAVSAGRRSKFFTSTVTTNRAEAEAEAARRSAVWHMEQAAELLKKATMDGAYDIGREAVMIVDDVTDRAAAEDPNFHPGDPKGWTA